MSNLVPLAYKNTFLYIFLQEYIFVKISSSNKELYNQKFKATLCSRQTDNFYTFFTRKRAGLKRQFKRTIKDEILLRQIDKLRLISGTAGRDNLAIFCIRFSPNYRFLLTTSNSGHLTYYDPKDGTIINRVAAHGDASNGITFLSENQFFTNSVLGSISWT